MLIAGFWVRLLAQIVDGVIWSALATALGLALVASAPAYFGLSAAVIEERSCRLLPAVPPQITPPAGLTPGAVAVCTKSILGYAFRREIVLVEERREGSVTTRTSATYPVDADLRLRAATDIDAILWLLFPLYVVLAQARFGATLGKRLFGLRVVDDQGHPAGLRRALIRNAVLWSPTLLLILAATVFVSTSSFPSRPSILLLLVAVVVALASLALGGQIWWTASHERPSIHDRIAGTRVVRTRPLDRQEA